MSYSSLKSNLYLEYYLIQLDSNKRLPCLSNFDQIKICRRCRKPCHHSTWCHTTRKWRLKSTKFLERKQGDHTTITTATMRKSKKILHPFFVQFFNINKTTTMENFLNECDILWRTWTDMKTNFVFCFRTRMQALRIYLWEKLICSHLTKWVRLNKQNQVWKNAKINVFCPWHFPWPRHLGWVYQRLALSYP